MLRPGSSIQYLQLVPDSAAHLLTAKREEEPLHICVLSSDSPALLAARFRNIIVCSLKTVNRSNRLVRVTRLRGTEIKRIARRREAEAVESPLKTQFFFWPQSRESSPSVDVAFTFTVTSTAFALVLLFFFTAPPRGVMCSPSISRFHLEKALWSNRSWSKWLSKCGLARKVELWWKCQAAD